MALNWLRIFLFCVCSHQWEVIILDYAFIKLGAYAGVEIAGFVPLEKQVLEFLFLLWCKSQKEITELVETYDKTVLSLPVSACSFMRFASHWLSISSKCQIIVKVKISFLFCACFVWFTSHWRIYTFRICLFWDQQVQHCRWWNITIIHTKSELVGITVLVSLLGISHYIEFSESSMFPHNMLSLYSAFHSPTLFKCQELKYSSYISNFPTSPIFLIKAFKFPRADFGALAQ